jgi:PAS domain S-box-containing protein
MKNKAPKEPIRERKEKRLHSSHPKVAKGIMQSKQTKDDVIHLLIKAVETIPIGLTITNIQGKIVYTNSTEAKIHGYSPDEVIGKDTRIFAPREKWKIIPFEKLRGLKHWHRESLNIRKNGEVFPVYLISVPVIGAHGKPVGIITTCEDITNRKKAEKILFQRQEAFHSVYKIATTSGGSFQDLCDEVISSLAKLLQVSHCMVLRFTNGKSKIISALAKGKLDNEAKAYLNHSLNIPAHNKKEIYKCKSSLKELFRHSPYAEFDLKSLICVPVLETKGESVGAIVIMDEQEREFTEDDINLMKIFSKYIAFEIEREAMEVKLLNAQKMEVVGKLAGGVAHEVRNPLNAIMIFTETLTRDLESNKKYEQLIYHIRSQVERLAEMMKDLLNLGKPVEKSHLNRESLDAICLASVDLWRHSQFGLTCKVTVQKPQDYGNIFIMADSQRLQQVFFNLLDNAAKHSPEGSEIQLIIKKPDGNMCDVQIIDRGSGVPEQILPRIFDPFFTTRRGGTGLGLSIVKHIVEIHGGSVEIFNNEPPPGCTVEVSLPISDK